MASVAWSIPLSQSIKSLSRYERELLSERKVWNRLVAVLAAVKDNASSFFILLGIGLAFGLMGEGYYLCNLLVEYDFQFNGRNYSGAYYLSKAELFDKLREGDPLPLKVLRLDPSVYKVRERRLANMLKGRESEHPSQVPDGAEISQLV